MVASAVRGGHLVSGDGFSAPTAGGYAAWRSCGDAERLAAARVKLRPDRHVADAGVVVRAAGPLRDTRGMWFCLERRGIAEWPTGGPGEACPHLRAVCASAVIGTAGPLLDTRGMWFCLERRGIAEWPSGGPGEACPHLHAVCAGAVIGTAGPLFDRDRVRLCPERCGDAERQSGKGVRALVVPATSAS